MKKSILLSVLSLLAIVFTLQASQVENSGKIIWIEKLPVCNNDGDLISYPVYIETMTESINTTNAFNVSKSDKSLSVIISAGGLSSALTSEELTSITNLTLKGTIDARDFKTMRDNMSSLSDIDFSETDILEYNGKEGTYDTINMLYPANEIPKYAFGNRTYSKGDRVLNTVNMSLTTKTIGDYAFQYCINLTSINIGSSVISIGNSAFYNCPGLSTVFIPASVSNIGESAFLGNICLINVDTGNTAYSSIEGILFDKNQTTLIKLPNNFTGIYNIPSTVSAIASLAFFGCQYLYEVTIPNTVTSFGRQAFSYCRGLNTVFIPSSVTTIGIYAFMASSCLITVDDNNTNYSSSDGLLFNKTKTTLIQCPTSKYGNYIIPASVTTLSGSVFRDCSSLTAVTIPSSIANIPYSCFNSCSALTSITIPASVTYIGGSAIYNCNNLASLYVYSEIPVNLSNSTDVFYNVNKTSCKLYVPIGSTASYQAATEWKDFTNIVEMTTGLLPLGQSNIRIMNKDKMLIILNAELGSKVKIFTVSGIKVREQTIENNQTTIPLPTGVYLLRIGNYSDKIIIK
ncbi:MAG: leucine-rich repeat domain-containing protein [Paludibacter sp.]